MTPSPPNIQMTNHKLPHRIRSWISINWSWTYQTTNQQGAISCLTGWEVGLPGLDRENLSDQNERWTSQDERQCIVSYFHSLKNLNCTNFQIEKKTVVILPDRFAILEPSKSISQKSACHRQSKSFLLTEMWLRSKWGSASVFEQQLWSSNSCGG